MDQFYRALELTAKSRIERDSTFDRFAARVLLDCVSREVLGQESTLQQRATDYNQQFANYIKIGIEYERLDPRLAEFDLQRLTKAIVPARDMLFDYLGIGTIYDRYLLQVNKRRIEMPQWLFMRVAMGLALNETDREARVIEFYNTLSSFDFMSSTPTLFNAGTQRPQLSSCYLTTIADDLGDIYMGI
ncbi:MAG: ribonucleotide reductase N-terminal alpha domain-containing protein, partial [Rhodococcus sp. (in: high G+C Gram-positive bacteria)]|nr:ribonucleotide reductase N-terminal alpha domain-containing protein [Rhodococcus sp. (in: high G+C Gram-positive bacteria)]